MSTRNLSYLFTPKSVVLIGASSRPHSVGATVLSNLLISCAGWEPGRLMAINPHYTQLQDVPVYPDVASLPCVPDLAVIATPPATVPGLVSELGAKGTRAAVVLSAGMGADHGDGRSHRQAMLDAARPYVLRILGPNCVGLISPHAHVNASFAHTDALPGKIAFISQSGALLTAMLDWARSNSIGFSHCISLGDVADVDFGDVLDFLATDSQTASILLYIEEIRSARKFMSAARAAARSKPVLVVKAGRAPEGARAAASHTGAMAGVDAVYDAAFRRAGMLRVISTEELFDVAETLAQSRELGGDDLLILTNGGGPGVMATDALILGGGRLATLADSTRDALDKILPANWSGGNPIDIIGDAPAERYLQALSILFEKQANTPVLFIHAPTAIVPSLDIARAILPLAQRSDRQLLACWMGEDGVAQARHVFAQAGIPEFSSPERAVNAFLQMVEYRRNQQLLMQVPVADPISASFDLAAARTIIATVLSENRSLLSEPEAKALLAACGIPVVETRVATTPAQARVLAEQIGFPVTVKVLSSEISHKTDVGGVILDLPNAEAVEAAAITIQQRLQRLRPDAKLTGFSIQAMIHRPHAQELIVGVSTDPVFGPVILFGQGGIAVEVMNDRALALPPLNTVLARDLIDRTRVARLLKGYRDHPPANEDAIYHLLLRVSQLVVNLPHIIELDINPILADAEGVIALDARIKISSSTTLRADDRLAIRPYPHELEQTIEWMGKPLLLRPIRPEDSDMHQQFFNSLAPEDIHSRLFAQVRQLQTSVLARMTQIDYDREMAFIAVCKNMHGVDETIGVVRAISDPDNDHAEFAIVVRSDCKGQGLGRVLMMKLLDYFRHRGTRQIVGETLPDNHALLQLVRQFNFRIHRSAGSDTVVLTLDLQGT